MEWCELNHLQLNITKTKEFVVNPISIRVTEVDIVKDYICLRVHIDNKTELKTQRLCTRKVRAA